MTRNRAIRQLHRWLSIVFTLAVLANFAALAWAPGATWVALLAVVPLIPLMLTGLWLYALPYLAARRGRSAER